MTQQQKEQISKLRANGASFGKIASALGISINTIKSYCKRNPILSEVVPAPKAVIHADRCPQCNATLAQSPGHRQKRFCSPKCRIAWWAAHPEQMTRKKLFSVECQHCGGVFITGLMCAVADKKLSSSVGFRGICKKVLIIMLVGVAHIVDLHVVGTGNALRGAVVCFYLSNEGVLAS